MRAIAVALLAACTGGGDKQPEPIERCTTPVDMEAAHYKAPAACTSQQSDIVGYVTDAADFEDRIVAQWLMCTSPSVWGTTDEVGFEVRADGTWANLYADASGNLTASTDPATTGTWDSQLVYDHTQLNLGHASDGGMILLAPYFSDTPAMMHVTNEGIYTTDYIRNDTSGRCSGVPQDPPAGEYTAPAACATLGSTEVGASSESAAQAAILGRWFSCEGTPFGVGEDNGIEFLDDGTFFRLYAAADGTMQREHGFNRQGTYTLFDNGSNIQLNMDIAGGTVISVPRFGTSPASLLINNNGVYKGHYLHE